MASCKSPEMRRRIKPAQRKRARSQATRHHVESQLLQPSVKTEIHQLVLGQASKRRLDVQPPTAALLVQKRNNCTRAAGGQGPTRRVLNSAAQRPTTWPNRRQVYKLTVGRAAAGKADQEQLPLSKQPGRTPAGLRKGSGVFRVV